MRVTLATAAQMEMLPGRPSKFGCSWVIVSSQPRMAPGLAVTPAIYISIIYISV